MSCLLLSVYSNLGSQAVIKTLQLCWHYNILASYGDILPSALLCHLLCFLGTIAITLSSLLVYQNSFHCKDCFWRQCYPTHGGRGRILCTAQNCRCTSEQDRTLPDEFAHMRLNDVTKKSRLYVSGIHSLIGRLIIPQGIYIKLHLLRLSSAEDVYSCEHLRLDLCTCSVR